MRLFSSFTSSTSRTHTRALSTRPVDNSLNIRSAVLAFGLAAALLGAISAVTPAVAESAPTGDVANRAAMAISPGSVSDDFADAMRGVVSDTSQDPCSDFTRAVSTGIQAAAPAPGKTGSNPSVAMSQTVATSLLGMVTSFCAFTPGEPPPANPAGPNIIINIKDACEDVKRQLANAEMEIKLLTKILDEYAARLRENNKTIEQQAKRIAQQDKDIAARDAMIRELQAQLGQCKAKLGDTKCAEAEDKVEKMQAQLNLWNSQLQKLEHNWDYNRPHGAAGQDLLLRQIAQARERIEYFKAQLKAAKAAQKKACS